MRWSTLLLVLQNIFFNVGVISEVLIDLMLNIRSNSDLTFAWGGFFKQWWFFEKPNIFWWAIDQRVAEILKATLWRFIRSTISICFGDWVCLSKGDSIRIKIQNKILSVLVNCIIIKSFHEIVIKISNTAISTRWWFFKILINENLGKNTKRKVFQYKQAFKLVMSVPCGQNLRSLKNWHKSIN